MVVVVVNVSASFGQVIMFAVGSFLEAKGFRLHELVFSEGVRTADADGIFVRI